MSETIQLGDISIAVARKDINNIRLSVYPPEGRVILSIPKEARLEVARAYVLTKVRWIRKQQEKLGNQARETPRQFIGRESHYVWGRRYLLTVVESNQRPCVSIEHRQIILSIRPGTDSTKRAWMIHKWHQSLLHQWIPALIDKWETKLKVKVKGYFLQRMKTRWGSCNPKSGHIRLNTELVKKPKDLVEYILVHEMLHLIEPAHNDRFFALLTKYYPNWREARSEINELPLTAEKWAVEQ